MKRVLLMICSILLVCACVFGLFACVAGVKDILAIQDYKLADQAMAVDGIATARDGIQQLKDNEATYVDGCVQYVDGKQQIADNTQAYNEGKEKLGTIEPIMPYLNTYMELRDGTIAKIPGFETAQAWFAAVVKPLGAELGLELPDDVNDLPQAINDMVVDGKAQLKVFEDGQAQIADGMEQLLAGMEASISRSGVKRVPSLSELLGEDFTYWALDDKGEVKVIRGCKYVDLDQCLHLCDEAEHYLELSGADTTKEIACRLVSLALLGIASVLGIIAGITAIVGKKPGFGSGLSAAIILVVANIVGVISHYGDFCYMPREIVNGVKEYTYVGDLQMAALIATAIVAIVFAIVAGAAKKTMKASAAFDDDIKAEARIMVQAQMAQYGMANIPEEYLAQYVESVLKDEKQRGQLRDSAITRRILAVVREQVTLDSKEVTLDEFNELFK